MRRVSPLVVLLVALVGCGGPLDEVGPSAVPTPFTQRPTSSGRPTVVPSESGATSVPAESVTSRGGRTETTGGGGDTGGGNSGGGNSGDGGGGDEDVRSVEFGGPTLDNSYPLDPFNFFGGGGVSSCILFSNSGASVPVTVHSVQLVDQQPSDDPGFELGDDPSAHHQCRSGGGSSDHEEIYGDCTNAELAPQRRTACPLEVRSIGDTGTDYTARLVLQLSATCTDTSGQPCARLTGRSDPTTADPVTMRWTDERLYTACLIPRDGWPAGPPDGTCPPIVEPSDTSSSSTDPDPGGDEGSSGSETDGQDSDDQPSPTITDAEGQGPETPTASPSAGTGESPP